MGQNAAKPLMIIMFTAIITSVVLIACNNPDQSNNHTIRKALELYTAEYVYEDILYYTDVRKFLFITTGRKDLLVRIPVKVTAGFVLDGSFSVTRKGNDIFLTIPPPVFLSVDVDDARIKEYFSVERNSRLGYTDLQKVFTHSKKRVLESDSVNGVYTMAAREGVKLLTQLLKAAGYKREYIHITIAAQRKNN